VFAVAVGVAAGIAAAAQLAPESPALQAFDFTYPWTAARALLRGENPYAAVRATQMPFGKEFSYPLPAAIVTAPLAWLPVRLAGCVFVAIGIGLFAFAITKEGVHRLILLASAPIYQAIRSLQWSPLITGAALLPGGLWLGAAKPTLLVALAAFRWRDRRAMAIGTAGAAILCVLSIALLPSWPAEWMRAIRSADASPAQYGLPIASILGAPVAVALLRWRAPEAWLILAMSCVPQSGFFYDQLPLLLVARSRREALFASACSVIALTLAFPLRSIDEFAARSAAYMPYVVIGMYWPAVLILLARGDNGRAAKHESDRTQRAMGGQMALTREGR
jgi:hypothetical protein